MMAKTIEDTQKMADDLMRWFGPEGTRTDVHQISHIEVVDHQRVLARDMDGSLWAWFEGGARRPVEESS